MEGSTYTGVQWGALARSWAELIGDAVGWKRTRCNALPARARAHQNYITIELLTISICGGGMAGKWVEVLFACCRSVSR